MENPYAAARAPAPEPPPRRALFSGIVAAVFCLLTWFTAVGYLGRNSFRFSKAGFFVEPSPNNEIASLQALWEHSQHLLLAASALCIMLGAPRLRVGALRRARVVSIWALAVGAYALYEFIVKSLSPLIAGMP
ncbi:hypothetical protein J5226_09270 [Lysobacter sp. K5869]|uniref:hypothetical protein n=1 Tax=Lysobacter sp. K5869 TaxID=2820808 RepID=UPI001C05F9B0|nr:hypothetical protein [Lysobacter sp. K5869]QWP78561.1 hypothetical protein J5226_09270 [Lysobacter sp. K5869]